MTWKSLIQFPSLFLLLRLLLFAGCCHFVVVEAFWIAQPHSSTLLSSKSSIFSFYHPNYILPRPCAVSKNNDYDNHDGNGEKDRQAQGPENTGGFVKRIQPTAGKAASKVKNGGSTVVSTAADLAGKGGSGIHAVYSTTSSYLSNLAEGSAERISTTSSGIVEFAGDLAEKGGSGIQSALSSTSTRLSDIGSEYELGRN